PTPADGFPCEASSRNPVKKSALCVLFFALCGVSAVCHPLTEPVQARRQSAGTGICGSVSCSETEGRTKCSSWTRIEKKPRPTVARGAGRLHRPRSPTPAKTTEEGRWCERLSLRAAFAASWSDETAIRPPWAEDLEGRISVCDGCFSSWLLSLRQRHSRCRRRSLSAPTSIAPARR